MESVFSPVKNRKGLTFAADCMASVAFRTASLSGSADMPFL